MLEQGPSIRRVALWATIASGALLWMAIALPAQAQAQTPVASCQATPTGGNTVGSAENAQSFTIPSNATVDAVELYLFNPFPATTTGDFVVQLFTADGTGPTDAPLATGTFPVANAPSVDPAPVRVAFSAPASLAAAQAYAIAVTKTGTGDAAVQARHDNPCPGGQVFWRNGSSGPWTPAPTEDLLFRLFESLPQAPEPDPEPQSQPGPKADRTLTLDANKGKVEGGRKVTLSGQIDSPPNEAACEPGQTVELQRKAKKDPDTAFETFTTVQSDQAGNYSTRVKVKRTGVYRAAVRETDTCDDEVSNTLKVRVQKESAAHEA